MARTRIPVSAADTAARSQADRLALSTAEIGLSVRTTNCLEERGIFTVEDLLHSTRDELLSISNFGEKTLEEVYQALEGIGFYRRHAGDEPLAKSAPAKPGVAKPATAKPAAPRLASKAAKTPAVVGVGS